MVTAMKNNKNALSMLKSTPWPVITAAAYAAAVLIWLPWYATGYLQIAQEKLSAFLGVTILAGLLLAATVPEKADATRWKRQGRAAAFSAGTILISALLSGDCTAALWGSGGYLGGFVLTAGALLGCMGTAVFLKDAQALPLPFIISGAGVTLLGILNNFGLDPLGFRTEISPDQHHLFFSTIGNADYLSAFLCLWLPLAMHRFAATGRAEERWPAFVCAEIGFLGMASLDSGLTALGLAGAAVLLLLLVPLTAREIARYAVLAAGWAAAQLIMGLLALRHPLLRTERPFAALAQPAVAVAVISACLLMALLLARKDKQSPGQVCLAAQRIVCTAAAVGTFVLLFLANCLGVSFGGLDNFLRVGPGWATGRGAIWVDVWYCFRQGTPLQILFGRGPGTVHTALAQMEESLPYHLTDTIGAHNEYLELLLTTGIAGLVAWGIFLGIALRAAGALLPREHQKRGWLLCVVAYLVQALFNNRVAAVFPVFMVLLGVLTSAPEKTAARQKTGGLLLAALLLTAAGTLAGNALLHYLFI